MSYLQKSQTTPVERVDQPFAGNGVQEVVQPVGKGDLSDWVELMEVVEALCPVWPVAPVRRNGGYRL